MTWEALSAISTTVSALVVVAAVAALWMRARSGQPYSVDIEYFAWKIERDAPIAQLLKRDYPGAFLDESGLAPLTDPTS